LFFGCGVERTEIFLIDEFLAATNECLREHLKGGAGRDLNILAKSFFDIRELPSAIFEETETAARRI
jgi:hypothetical protein